MAELEQFCILAKAQKGRACAALLQQVLAHKRIFNFSELLDVPSVQALRDSEEFQKSYYTLELFAYGTYNEFARDPTRYLELSDVSSTKLKILTLLSLASEHYNLKYADLLAALNIHSVRELEDLIIETIYAGLVSGKLDQRRQLFIVQSCQPRDCRSSEIDSVLLQLQQWRDSISKMQQVLTEQNSSIKQSREAAVQEQILLQQSVNETKKLIKDSVESGIDPTELEYLDSGDRRSRGGILNPYNALSRPMKSMMGNKGRL